MIYEFDIPGPVTGKGRPRVNTYTCRAYTPTKTKEYEEMAQQYFLFKYPRYVPIEGRTKVTIVAQFKIPKGTSKANAELMLKGEIAPTKKPDIDNIVKIVLDALNSIAFKDDNQITKLEIEKIYSEEEKVSVKIENY